MRRSFASALFVLLASTAQAAQPISVSVANLTPGGAIVEEQAKCKPAADGGAEPGTNDRPEVSWSKGPEGTQSYVLIMSDPDVPVDLSDMGKKDKVIADNVPRRVLYHWTQIDIPDVATMIPGSDSAADPSPGLSGTSEANPAGPYGGPCPPPNDQRVHHYHFRVYALDVPTLGMKPGFDPKGLEQALEGHVLARGETIGTYTLNPSLRK